jgi:protein subunit release factor A
MVSHAADASGLVTFVVARRRRTSSCDRSVRFRTFQLDNDFAVIRLTSHRCPNTLQIGREALIYGSYWSPES